MQEQRKKVKSIKVNVFIAFFVLVFVATIGGVAITYSGYSAELKKEMIFNAQQNTEAINSGIARYMKAMKQTTQLIVRNPQIKDNPLLLLEGVTESHDIVIGAYVASAPKGLVVYPLEEGVENEDNTDRPWFKAAVASSGEVCLTEVYFDRNTNEPMITLSQAINNQQVLGIDLSLKEWASDLANTPVGETGYLIVTDDLGTIIVHPKAEYIGKSRLFTIYNRTSYCRCRIYECKANAS